MPRSIVCTRPEEKSDLSLAGTQISAIDSFIEELPDEPCFLTNDDTFFLVDDDDPEDDLRPDRKVGAGIRWSEARPFEFWTYYDRFVRYWPKKKFNVKYAYQTGFVEKKRKGSDQPMPLFESYAIEMTERHLDSDSWGEWKKREGMTDPIWLGLHIPNFTTVDAIDIDAKQYLLGYYRAGSSALLKPVVHLPLEHFKLLKRVYDKFPGRVWCISSETLGIHAWKKHSSPRPALNCHQSNKQLLAEIGLGNVESHPMPGRCFRRPFGADYRTITPDGVLTHWIAQLNYFENDGRTPDFITICQELVKAMRNQWENWKSYGSQNKKLHPAWELEKYQHELKEVADWLAAGCPLEMCEASVPFEKVDPVTNLCREVLAVTFNDTPQVEATPLMMLSRGILAVTFGEKPDDSVDPLLNIFTESSTYSLTDNSHQSEPRPQSGFNRNDLASMRGGKWVKELLRLAHVGLEQEDSVATVVHEMAKWLWWIELHSLPEAIRRVQIVELLTEFVITKHNGCVTRLNNGLKQDVINQIVRCVEMAAKITNEKSLKEFAKTRQKWLNGGYKYPIRIVPVLRNETFTDAASLRSDRTGSPFGSTSQATFSLRGFVSEFAEEEDVSVSSSCLFTLMCIKFDEPLPYQVQSRIMSQAGRNKLLPFATLLLNRLYNNKGKEYLGRTTLLKLLGYNNPTQLGKYLNIMEKSGVIKRGTSYSKGRNGKLITIDPQVMEEIAAARDIPAIQT